jgi:hypothetical protein
MPVPNKSQTMANLAQKTSIVAALTSVVEPTDGAAYWLYRSNIIGTK